MLNQLMKNFALLLMLVCVSIGTYGQSKVLLFKTNYGDFKVMLYDTTPKHRDLMLQAIKDSVYHQALFNRIIKDFVVQGGEHDVDIAKREQANPQLPRVRFDAEFHDDAFHKMGALGAGRDDNPEKASFVNQIYFVVGKKVTAVDLDNLEKKKNIKYTAKQRETYLAKGGLPRLDYDYTVFGEVTEGFDVLLRISNAATNKDDYPLEKVVFDISIIK